MRLGQFWRFYVYTMRQRQSHIALIKLVACSFCDYVISFSTVVAKIRSSDMAAVHCKIGKFEHRVLATIFLWRHCRMYCMATEFYSYHAVFPVNLSTNEKVLLVATGCLDLHIHVACNRQVNHTHSLHLNEIQGHFCWLLARAVPRPDYHATNAT